MNNKKRISRWLLVFLILLALTITGCNKNGSNDSETTIGTESESQCESESQSESESPSESQDDSETQIDSDSQSNSETQAGSDDKNNNESQDNNGGQANTETPSNSESQSGQVGSTENDTADTEELIPTSDPYEGMSSEEFYANYKPATSLQDALYRSKHGFLSGSLEVPGQYAQDADYRPMENGLYLRNTGTYYRDNGQTYVVVDGNGKEVMRIYKGGAYITLEEVAAYMYAFGGSSDSLPANYTSKKNTSPKNSIWGEYLRLNHSYFLGNTNKYPYEPELPNISGCGGSSQYYEMDIGTTGTETPGYAAKLYNNGVTISRGAARLVYTRQDLNGNGVYEQDEVHVFYTHNHYNDFREYLNYYGGWGEMFGNVTGGGEYSSKTNCNPTPYVPTGYKLFMQ